MYSCVCILHICIFLSNACVRLYTYTFNHTKNCIYIYHFFKHIHAYISQCNTIFCQSHLAPGDGVAASDIAIVYSFDMLSPAYSFPPPSHMCVSRSASKCHATGLPKKALHSLYEFDFFFHVDNLVYIAV